MGGTRSEDGFHAGRARLPAAVQPQVWVNDNAVDAGEPIHFDAHEAMLGLDGKAFARVAGQVFGVGNDYDELALDSGVIEQWLSGGKDSTFVVTVEESDLEEWLEGMGCTREDALMADDAFVEALRARQSPRP